MDTLPETLATINIVVEVLSRPSQTPITDDKGWKHFPWLLRLAKKGSPVRSEPIPYKCGIAHVSKLGIPKCPTAADVVHSLILDSSACDMSHSDWCAEYGYDTDSRSGLETYLACQDSGRAIRAFLGEDYKAVAEAAADY